MHLAYSFLSPVFIVIRPALVGSSLILRATGLLSSLSWTLCAITLPVNQHVQPDVTIRNYWKAILNAIGRTNWR